MRSKKIASLSVAKRYVYIYICVFSHVPLNPDHVLFIVSLSFHCHFNFTSSIETCHCPFLPWKDLRFCLNCSWSACCASSFQPPHPRRQLDRVWTIANLICYILSTMRRPCLLLGGVLTCLNYIWQHSLPEPLDLFPGSSMHQRCALSPGFITFGNRGLQHCGRSIPNWHREGNGKVVTCPWSSSGPISKRKESKEESCLLLQYCFWQKKNWDRPQNTFFCVICSTWPTQACGMY